MTRFLPSRHGGRIIVGCLASPLSVAAVIFAYVMRTVQPSEFSIFTVETVATVMAGLSYVIALVFGALCHVLLTIRQKTALMEYMIIGFSAGIVAPVTLLIMAFDHGDLMRDIERSELGEIIAVFGSLGLLGSLNAGTFWLLVRPGTGASKIADS